MWPQEPTSKDDAAAYLIRGIAATAGRLIVYIAFMFIFFTQLYILTKVAPETVQQQLAHTWTVCGFNISIYAPIHSFFGAWALTPLVANIINVISWAWGER